MTKRDYKMAKLIDEIRKFLIYSAKNGYGNTQAKTTDEADGSHTIEVVSGDLRLNDSYFGGEPYGGREVIFLGDKAVWMMAYYGAVIDLDDTALQDVYGYLRKNLLNPDPEMPIRGPRENQEGEWSYTADIKGDLTDFKCEETITHNEKVVYEASFRGGLVDQQND
jgi:hypothetical protein